MNKDEIEAMGKFFKQAFDMSNGSSPETKFELSSKAKEILNRYDSLINELTARVDNAVKRGTEGRRNLKDEINNLKKEHENLSEFFNSEMNRLRKDYRELEQEVKDDLTIIKDWIIATQSSDKERIRIELERYKEIEKGKLTTGMILGSNASLTPNVPRDIPKSLDDALLERPVSELELSIRSLNVLANTNIKTVKQLIQYSFNELLAFKGLGRKCVHEIQGVIEELGLGLAFKEAS